MSGHGIDLIAALSKPAELPEALAPVLEAHLTDLLRQFPDLPDQVLRGSAIRYAAELIFKFSNQLHQAQAQGCVRVLASTLLHMQFEFILENAKIQVHQEGDPIKTRSM